MSTILLVEDDAALRDGLTELFTREGYSVTTAANAAEARQNFSVYSTSHKSGHPFTAGV